MSNDQVPVAAVADGAQYVQLFQKAHQKIVTLDRLEEQVAQLLSKREELQEELKELQAQINEELEARIRSGIESPAKALSAIAGSVTGRNGAERFGSASLTGLAQ
jgi:TolA-binding protein